MTVFGVYFAAGAGLAVTRQSPMARVLPSSVAALVLAGPLGYSLFSLGWASTMLLLKKAVRMRRS